MGVIPSGMLAAQNQIESIAMALSFHAHSANTDGNVNNKENTKKKPLLL